MSNSEVETSVSDGGRFMGRQCEKQVRKRDGDTLQQFDPEKIRSAIRKAWKETSEAVEERALGKVLRSVLDSLPDGTVDVETIQDVVETCLMRHKKFSVAKLFIVYRQHRTEARQARIQKSPDPNAISNYIHASKYARYIEDQQRREVFEETVARVEDMHVRRFPLLKNDIKEAFNLVREKRVLPSMRALQFGGEAIEANHNRLYNCSATHIDRMEAFSEALYLLLCGCGVGYSIQFEHVEQLPALSYVDPKKIRHHVIADSIEGWADALKALLQGFLDGVYVEFAYHMIREAGAPLKTSGGRAPGHVPLKTALERIRKVLEGAQGRKLRSVECHRILCHAADAVLSGGIRRSAMIALFSLEDSEMMQIKTGNWYVSEPWLANANNSVVLKRDDVKKKAFKRIFKMTQQWGEPGFLFVDDCAYVVNPCAEVGFCPQLTITPEIQSYLLNKYGISVEVGTKYTGWAFCNLCEINAAKFKTREDFMRAVKAATVIGTLQASYTDFFYLGWVSEEIAKRDALLGVGMTGMFDAPEIALNAEMQREAVAYAKQINEEYATKIGINTAARLTVIKPSGTASLELGGVGSGHHPHHARRYIRRVTADELEHVFQAFKAVNPHMCIRKPDGKWVIEFPVEAPPNAILKEDIRAIPFLEMVKSTQQNWILPGTTRDDVNPGLHNNVSNTVVVRPDEWDDVADYLWDNREFFTGVSLLPSTGDKDYAFAPLEAVTTVADEARWNTILASYQPVDYFSITETYDSTSLKGEVACAGGACSIV